MITDLVELNFHSDTRGALVTLEESGEIPFKIQRIFYIYNTNETCIRGSHAHYKTNQFLVAVHGHCKVDLDNGQEKQTFWLNQPYLGLFQKALTWGTMYDFSQDCVLLVLADSDYDEDDYIRDYNHFKEIVNNPK